MFYKATGFPSLLLGNPRTVPGLIILVSDPVSIKHFIVYLPIVIVIKGSRHIEPDLKNLLVLHLVALQYY